MCHKKFVAEFVRKGGVQKFLEIPRQSMSSTGMSLCVYYLGYSSDAMEKVYMMKHFSYQAYLNSPSVHRSMYGMGFLSFCS